MQSSVIRLSGLGKPVALPGGHPHTRTSERRIQAGTAAVTVLAGERWQARHKRRPSSDSAWERQKYTTFWSTAVPHTSQRGVLLLPTGTGASCKTEAPAGVSLGAKPWHLRQSKSPANRDLCSRQYLASAADNWPPQLWQSALPEPLIDGDFAGPMGK